MVLAQQNLSKTSKKIYKGQQPYEDSNIQNSADKPIQAPQTNHLNLCKG